MHKAMRFAFMCREKLGNAGSRVAIVGAGPAGLGAAGYLSCRGYEVEVYDKLPLPGGLMVFAIPPWRISKDAVLSGAKELEESLGVKFILKTKVYLGDRIRRDEGDDFVERIMSLDKLIDEYDAVIIATGTWESKLPKLPGVESRGVTTALAYLYKHRIYELGLTSRRPEDGKRVVVIGGGYSAIDAAEQALNNGSYPYLVYRRTIKEAPAGVYEFMKAVSAGINVIELASPIEIVAEGGIVKGVKFQRMKLGSLDETGRPKPIPVPGSEFFIEADTVIFATGEAATPPFNIDEEGILNRLKIRVFKEGNIEVLKEDSSINQKVYVAGDVARGPSRIGPALGMGLQVARKVDYILQARAGKLALVAR